MLLGLLLTLIFVALSLLHWFWVVRGGDDLAGFVPEVEGRPTITPGRFVTSVVAILLLVAAALCASQAELFGVPRVPLARIGVWGLAVVFMLRAIGDFRTVGFFKKVRDTKFGQRDTRIFSPLCFTISALCGALLSTTP